MAVTDPFKKEQGQVATLLVGAREERGAETFLSNRTIVLSYLQYGEEVLYPNLRVSAEREPNLKFFLELYAGTADATAKMVRDFFRKHTKVSADYEFITDFGKVVALLGQRIRNETSLLGEYARFTSKAKPKSS